MRRSTKSITAALCLLLAPAATAIWAWSPPKAAQTGFEEAVAPDPDDRPLNLRIWYPEGLTRESRAPLVVISHGTGGSNNGHSDTATALAKAGFVVVAMDHSGDNYRDASYVGKGTHLAGRPRHISRTLDFMLSKWSRRASIDPARIGLFGHSAGGFTALVVAGAETDLRRGSDYCTAKPHAWTCRYLRRNGYTPDRLARQRALAWHHDPRIKAIVIAAPAIGYSFDKASLSQVRIPVQIWAAGKDDVVDDSPTTIRASLSGPVEYRLVPGAGHFSFLAPCDTVMHIIIAVMHRFGTEDICADPAGFDRAQFHDGFNTSVAHFFRDQLRHAGP